MNSLIREKLTTKRWFRWLLILAVWTLIGLVFTFQSYLEMQHKGKPMDWRDSLSWQLIWWYTWIPLSFAIIALGKRYPIDLKHWGHRLLIHIPVSFVISALHMILHSAIYWAVAIYPEKPPSVILEKIKGEFAEGNFHVGILTYFVILGIQILGSFYTRIREEKLHASQLETELAHTELQTLKVQLQPHFLFNTLRYISTLLRRDVDEADRMIARLGDFLRLTLQSSGSEDVTLRSELEFLQSYLDIEQIRFHDRLITRMHIEPDALDTRVPHLILQPIVENTFLGRMESSASPGELDIIVKRNNGILQLQIKNDSSSAGLKESSELMETRLRLRQIYGSKYRFEISRDPGGMQTVTLEIPVTSGGMEPEPV
jgi:two-component system LytT family sensor kinase